MTDMTPDPWAELERGAAAGPLPSPGTSGGGDGWPPITSHPLPAGRGYSPAVSIGAQPRPKPFADLTQNEAFWTGFADSATFGFSDEIWAFGKSTFGFGDYETNLAMNRAYKQQLEDEYWWTYTGGQVVGGFVPLTGWASRVKAVGTVGKSAIGAAVKAGAVGGAVAGAGSSESVDLFTFERVRDAAVGGLAGAVGGAILQTTVIPAGKWIADKAVVVVQRGGIPKLNFKFNIAATRPGAVADDVADDLTDLRLTKAKAQPGVKAADDAVEAVPTAVPGVSATVTKPKPKNVLTGVDEDVVEDGAVLATKELKEAPKDPRIAALDKVAKLSPQQAKTLAKKLDKARESGDLASDPHYRSILGLNMDDVAPGDELDVALKAAELFEEVNEAILEKSKLGAKTQKSLEDELRRQYGGTVTEAQLDELVAKQADIRGSANVGSTMMALAGVQFMKATKVHLPLVLKGDANARQALVDEMTKAIRISAKGRFLVSEAGRNLGMLNKNRMLAFTEISGDKVAVESAESIAKKLKDAMANLNDSELGELMARVRDLSDLEIVQEVLLNVEAASQVAMWKRATNSFSTWLKSNTLTPMSGAVNFVGFAIHDAFRNGWAKSFAAHVARKAGRVEEAQILAFSNQIAKQVRWAAHAEGARAALSRLKWEALGDLEKIFGVAGAGRIARRASAAKIEMLQRGYSPPPLREQDMRAGLAIEDVAGFNRRLQQRADEGGGLAKLVNAIERVYATGINTLDAAGTATGKIVTGVLDDWGRSFVRAKEIYAQSAAYATREGIEAGLNEKQLLDYVPRRAAELAELPPVDLLEQVERKLIDGEDLDQLDHFLLRRDWEAERESEKVLFMDGPQTVGGRWAAQTADYVDKAAGGFIVQGVLMTYIRTPVRIMERGLMSYTPWAAKTDEVRKILERGGLEAAVERARIELASMIMGIGAMASAAGIMQVTNGGYKNSKNLEGAPANSIQLPGGAYVEFGRLDPISMTLALGGIMGQAASAFVAADNEYGRDEAISAMVQTSYMAIRDAVLEKSYLTGARDLMKAWFGQDDTTLTAGMAKIWTSAITRTIPFSGTSRQVSETIVGRSTEAVGFFDQLLKSLPGGAAYLPARIDALGNEAPTRKMGLAVGIKSDDPVVKELARLGIDITVLQKADPKGFDLDSGELSELRRIRGKEALNPDGLTMGEALSQLFANPEFQRLPSKEQKQDAVVSVMGEFNEPAREIFEERNQDYLATREAGRSFGEYLDLGYSRPQAKQQTQYDLGQLGLPDKTDRLK